MDVQKTDAIPRQADDAHDEQGERDEDAPVAGDEMEGASADDDSMPTGDEPIDQEIADDAEVVEPRHSIDQLPDGFWHAPRGPLTKLFAWLILLLIVGCVAAMVVAILMAALG